jgi:hypothetical protein
MMPVERPKHWRRVRFDAVAVIVLVATVCRGLDHVSVYALGHWLLTWDFGYVKRGLLGTLLHPLIMNKQPSEVREIVAMVASVVFTLLAIALLQAARSVARVGGLGALNSLAFLSSCGVIGMASTFGYLDHVLGCVTFLALVAVGRGRWAVASMLCTFGLAVHELFLLYGLPVVFFSMVLRSSAVGSRRSLPVVASLLPPFAFLLFVFWAQTTVSPERVGLLRAEMLSTRTLDEPAVGSVLYQLESSFSGNFAQHARRFPEHVLDWKIGRIAWPTLASLIGASVALLWSGGRARLAPLALLVSLAPLGIHAFAQDASRFTYMAVVQSFFCVYAVVSGARPTVPPRVLPQAIRVGLMVTALLAIAASLHFRAPLMGRLVDGRGMYAPRAQPLAQPGPR